MWWRCNDGARCTQKAVIMNELWKTFKHKIRLEQRKTKGVRNEPKDKSIGRRKGIKVKLARDNVCLSHPKKSKNQKQSFNFKSMFFFLTDKTFENNLNSKELKRKSRYTIQNKRVFF
jgi:hypothetical protein